MFYKYILFCKLDEKLCLILIVSLIVWWSDFIHLKGLQSQKHETQNNIISYTIRRSLSCIHLFIWENIIIPISDNPPF